ncbi:hypothetical protein E2C01_087296 [Portunus trituberculatus]|uniref:Uncharacterized protein n=1 Tax=Portunus trituberculatus TaxID=210409 RepID=A0A5B7J682_PORTR|nr:hypothetical protein [Portunus trituberculatus]
MKGGRTSGSVWGCCLRGSVSGIVVDVNRVRGRRGWRGWRGNVSFSKGKFWSR